MPALDQRPRLPVALLRVFAQVVRRVPVHHYFSGDKAHVQAQGLGKQRLDRFRMQRAKHQRGGGAVAHKLLNEKFGDLFRVGLIGKLALHREGVGGQPLQQLFAKGADHLRLRVMDVGVDKTGQQQPAAQVGIAFVRVKILLALLPRHLRQNFSVLDKQQAVLKVARVPGNGVCAVADPGNIKKCTAYRSLVFHHGSCLRVCVAGWENSARTVPE